MHRRGLDLDRGELSWGLYIYQQLYVISITRRMLSQRFPHSHHLELSLSDTIAHKWSLKDVTIGVLD